MRFFSKPTEEEVSLIFDIGSGSIGGALVRFSPLAAPVLFYTVRLDFPHSHSDVAHRLVSRMLQTLSQAALAVMHEGLHAFAASGAHPKVAETFIILAAPWVVSHTSELHLERKEPFSVTRAVLASLLAEHRKEASAPHALLRGHHELVPIEETLVRARVNEYPTEHPFGKMGRAVSLSVFSSFAPRHIVRQIGDTISHTIASRRQTFHSFALAEFAVARDLFSGEEDFLCIDFGNEQTEVSITKRGVPEEVATFPFGRNQVLRALDASGHFGAATSAAFLKLYAEKKGVGPRFERGAVALRSAAASWQRGFQKTLRVFAERWMLPRRVFFTADDDIVSVLSEFIRPEEDETVALFGTPLLLVVLDAARLAPHCEVAASVSADAFLTLESVFAARLLSIPHPFEAVS